MLRIVPDYIHHRAESRVEEIKKAWPEMDIDQELLTQTIVSHMLDGGHESEVDVRPPTPGAQLGSTTGNLPKEN